MTTKDVTQGKPDWRNALREREQKLITSVTTLTPWGTSLIPAYFTGVNTYKYLVGGIPVVDWVFAVVVGFVTEFVNIAAVNTATEFWQFNQHKKKDVTYTAPTGWAIGAVVFYAIIILTVNVLLEINHNALVFKVTAIGLLSLLSLDGALVIGLRNQHNNQTDVIAFKKQQSKNKRAKTLAAKKKLSAKVSTTPKVTPNVSATSKPGNFRTLKHSLSDDDLKVMLTTPLPELATAHGITERAAASWVGEYIPKEIADRQAKATVTGKTKP